LFAWGAAAMLGLAISGPATDRRGPRAVIRPALLASTFAFVLLSLAAHLAPRTWALVPVMAGVVAWGIGHWAFYPAQQATLAGLAGPQSVPVVLSLNASFMYLGFSLGAALGSLTIAFGGVADLGYASAAGMVAALALDMAGSRRATFPLNPA
jgi:predicted MFS family arabinose efflux permease